MTEPTPTALLIEDEPHIRRFVRSALEEEGWQVFEAATMQRGLIDAATRKPDIVILDLGLPDGDGMDCIPAIRTWSALPIIVLSARSNEQEKIKALDAGADDYLSKPFGVGELLARVRTALRHQRHPEAQRNGRIQFGAITLNLETRRVDRAGETIHLTPIEYRLLSALATHAGYVVTTRQLLCEVWGPSHSEDSHYLRIYMGHLRQKLENDPTQPRYLLTETAVGYRLLLV